MDHACLSVCVRERVIWQLKGYLVRHRKEASNTRFFLEIISSRKTHQNSKKKKKIQFSSVSLHENYHYLNVYDRYVSRGLYAKSQSDPQILGGSPHTNFTLWEFIDTDKNTPMQKREKPQFQFQGKTASAFHLLDRLALLSV